MCWMDHQDLKILKPSSPVPAKLRTRKAKSSKSQQWPLKGLQLLLFPEERLGHSLRNPLPEAPFPRSWLWPSSESLKDDHNGKEQASAEPQESLLKGRHLATIENCYTTRRRSSAFYSLSKLRHNLAERLAVNIGSEAHDSLHIVTVNLSHRRSVFYLG